MPENENKKQAEFLVTYHVGGNHKVSNNFDDVIETFDDMDKALMFYSQAPGNANKSFDVIWDNNKSDVDYDPLNYFSFTLFEAEGPEKFSQLSKIPEEMLEREDFQEMLKTPEYDAIENRAVHYINREEMKLPKTYYLGNMDSEEPEKYIQTQLGHDFIECKFFNDLYLPVSIDRIPFASETDVSLFKNTLSSYLDNKLETGLHHLQSIDTNEFNNISKEQTQKDSLEKLDMDDNLLDALDKIDWSLNIVKTDFFYDVEFTSKNYKLNVEFYMNEGDSLNDKVQPVVDAHLNSQSPYSEEISKEYQTEFKKLGNTVKKWDKAHTRSVNAKLKAYNKEVSEQPQKAEKIKNDRNR